MCMLFLRYSTKKFESNLIKNKGHVPRVKFFVRFIIKQLSEIDFDGYETIIVSGSLGTQGHIHNTSFSSQHTNWPAS
jgi:hypothetical protein